MSASTTPATSSHSAAAAMQIALRGPVQGHGIRPTVLRLAIEHQVRGFVRNTSDGVDIHAEADHEALLQAMLQDLRHWCSTRRCGIGVHVTTAAPRRADGFVIDSSFDSGPRSVMVPPDVRLCRECRREVEAADNRRHEYAFTSCTDCGPRYSVTRSLPWDRERTSMQDFALCRSCSDEFADPFDRRCYAQTNACPDCGPQLWAVAADRTAHTGAERVFDAAVRTIRDGQVVAIKGIGGYQLICDAASAAAVATIRERKRRHSKPLAIMIRDRIAVRELSTAEQTLLENAANPIVLIDDPRLNGIAAAVNPGSSSLGIFLPTTALHQTLLNRLDRPLVVTSANVDGDPILSDSEQDVSELHRLADLIVHHNRLIERPVDDSVVRVIADRCVTIRCGRGLAPLPLPVSDSRSVLATGGHQKVAIALSNGHQAVLGPHIGDLSGVGARQRFVQHVDSMLQLYKTRPALVVHDLHPDYFTTRWSESSGIPHLVVQHHHAHVAAGILEHQLADQPVLGLAFDGSGYGTDGTIWGGEFLIATLSSYHRAGRLKPFALPGGDAAVRAPWRTAVALLAAAEADDQPITARWTDMTASDAARVPIVRKLAGSSQTVRTSSFGRLFDGVAAIALSVTSASYEGEPAIRLEAICDMSEPGRYEFLPDDRDGLVELDWRPVIRAIVADVRDGVPAGSIAMRFHRGVAAAAARVAGRFGQHPVVCCGGCFQNRILTELLADDLATHPAGVFLPGRIPPNDGGLAAGQLAVALASSAGKGRVV